MRGGKRPNSGRKKGSTPWNKGVPMKFESKLKLSGALKGCKAWNKGIPMSVETKAKIRLAKLGKQLWPNGRSFSKETRLKMSVAKQGKTSNWKGKIPSEDTRNKLSVAAKNYLKSVNPEYTYEIDTRTKIGNQRLRRERLRNSGGRHTKEEWENLKKIHSYKCCSCGKQEPEIRLTRDHIIAVSTGGTDDIVNIQPLCVSCNSKKSIKHIRY